VFHVLELIMVEEIDHDGQLRHGDYYSKANSPHQEIQKALRYFRSP
jgi:hypothetical protein